MENIDLSHCSPSFLGDVVRRDRWWILRVAGEKWLMLSTIILHPMQHVQCITVQLGEVMREKMH